MTPVRRSLLVVVSLASGGCMTSDPISARKRNPYCPAGWKLDATADGECSPPLGYTALVWAELGGSGAYGFVRSGSHYLACQAGTDALPCDVRMIGATTVDGYLATDVIDTTIRPDAIPVASTTTSSQGVYKLRLDPGQYRITGIDPVDGTRFWSPTLQVIPQALASCVIDVYPP